MTSIHHEPATTMNGKPSDPERSPRDAAPAPSSGGAGELSPFGGGGGPRRRVVRRALLVGIPVLALAGVWLATRSGSDEQAAAAGHIHGAAPAADSAKPVMLSGDEARRIGVTYAVASVTPLTREIRTVGEVTFDETRVRAIAPKIDGWVERLYVNFTGQSVRAGEPLLAIYSPMLVTAQEELLLARRLQGDVAGAAPDARGNVAELVSSARRRLAYWDIPPSEVARIERSGEVQRTLTLYAPAGGFVVEKNVLQGQRIMAGDALYRIADLSTVWIEGDVFEQDLPAVRLGRPVVAQFEALPGEQFEGRISYVYPTLDPETRTAKVRVEVPNPRLRLKPGMYATIRVTGAARPDAVTVPRSAVLATGERSLVFVRRPDGMLEPREVVLGVANDTRVEILRGLAAGETVVASATFLVDAESNLGTALGGMGNMPGMDMTAPTKDETPATAAPTSPPAGKGTTPAPGATPAPAPTPQPDHSGHEE
ncbi:MAG TPA: efflux RND transporter periplasmic adaptor subunit [Gemmatimonadaceae bacterium]|nr:efflux RND transporter periplasmic adaptor subunit [Gemmatimonadaceae bacterium]